MQIEKLEELLMKLANQMSAMQKDIEGIKTEMHSNYIRSDENDTAVRELVEERTKYACSRQDSIKAELKTEIELSKKASELNKSQIELLDTRLKVLEDEKKNRVYSRWEQIREKAFWIIVAIVFGAVFKYFNFVPPKPF